MGPSRTMEQFNVGAFQSTHPVWDGTRNTWAALLQGGFQSTHPVWDGTQASRQGDHQAHHFNPPIPCGMGRRPTSATSRRTKFQSTHPVWDGTRVLRAGCSLFPQFQSTHPVWDGTRRAARQTLGGIYFNPPIPCGMGREWEAQQDLRALFQSTHPVWDGTFSSAQSRASYCISIHPSRVGWDFRRIGFSYPL